MNLTGSLERARSLGPGAHKAAARHYNDIEHELALGDYTETQAEEGEAALTHLETAYPGVREAARQVTETPRLSRSAKQELDRPAVPIEARPRRPRRAARPAGVRGRVAGATAIHARPRVPGWASRRFAQTGIPAAGETATQLGLRTLGGLAGLSFLFLLLTPRGSRAVGLTSNGLTDVLRALANPRVDPLRPIATTPLTAAQAQAGGAPARAVGAITSGIDNSLNSIANSVGRTAAPRFHSVPGHRP